MRHVSFFRRRLGLSAAAVAALLTAGVGLAETHAASAVTTGCQVTYTVTNQWPGGFGANVSVNNRCRRASP
ncbi:cellulose binding domain-containing protein [Nonomuraea angiospora]